MTITVMRTSDKFRARLKDQEGLRLDAYRCTAGRWTIGWGHAETNDRLVRGLRIVYKKTAAGAETTEPELGEDGKPQRVFYEGKPKRGVSITLAEAQRLFDADLDDFERAVSALVTVDLAQNQYDPLIDFAFQFGVANLTGSTLLSKINFNPNNLGTPEKAGILDEFPRWNREKGVRTEHVWRRSCRRACEYAGAPIPQALWRTNGFPFALTEDDQIDYSITPTIHKIIAHGIKAAEPYKFDPSKPLPEPVNPAPPLPSPVEDEDELFLDTPAAAEETSGAKGSPPVREQPSPSSQAAVPSSNPVPSVELSGPGTGPAAAEKVAPRPSAPPVAVPAPPLPKPSNVPTPRPFDPPVIAGQGGTKPMHPETKMPDMIPYRIDPNAGAKPLESTERFLGSVFILLGTLTRTAMANGFKLSGASGVIVAWILTLMKDPVHFAIFVAFVAMAITGVLWLFGVCLQKFGIKKKRKGEAGSSQLMY